MKLPAGSRWGINNHNKERRVYDQMMYSVESAVTNNR